METQPRLVDTKDGFGNQAWYIIKGTNKEKRYWTKYNTWEKHCLDGWYYSSDNANEAFARIPQYTVHPVVLNLTKKQLNLLRNAASDLGTKDCDCVHIQLQIANALLDLKS